MQAWERVTSVVIALPAETVPMVRIGIDRNSGQFTYREKRCGSSQMCPDANNNQATPGTKVGIWTCSGGSNQQWQVP
jgi:hypothetical protein